MKQFICLILLLPIAYATDYYVSNNGIDSNNGQSTSNPWQTIAKVNSMTFSAGDTIHFLAGNVWRERLVVPSSGSSGNPLTFTRYGSGNNPIIKSSELITAGDWVHENPPSGHIYSYNTRAADDAWRNPFGAIANDQLLNRHWYYSYYASCISDYCGPSSTSSPVISEIESRLHSGFTWSPLNLGKIFIHSNGNPGAMEIGKRQNAIYMSGKDYVTIDSIDLYGPGGGGLDYDDAPNYYEIGLLTTSGRNLIVRNCVLKNNPYDAIRTNGDYCLYEDNTIENTWAGIRSISNAHHGTVRGNTFLNIGSQIVSNGDRSVVGSWGHHWLVEYNYIEGHGWEGQAESEGEDNMMDLAVTFCCGELHGGTEKNDNNIVRYNYFKDIGFGAVQLMHGDYGEVYYNIIDGWNLHIPTTESNTNAGAIKAATWSSEGDHPEFVGNKIYNNIITGGKQWDNTYKDAAILLTGKNTELEVKNNLIFGNEPGMISLFLNFGTGTRDNEISNNMISTTSGYAIRWWGDYYDSNHVISPTGCPNAGYWECDVATSSSADVHDNIVDNPLFTSGFHPASSSPVVNAGANVGLAIDYDGTSIVGLPDIGAQEYTGTTCSPDWECTGWSSWSACVGNLQSRTRTCTDTNNCGTTSGKPAESETQSCSVSQQDELVLYLTFDSVSGSTVTDSSGKSNSGTLTGGATVATGRVGQAASLDGVNDYISVSDSASLDFDKSAGTIMMWIRPMRVGMPHELLAIDSDFEIEFNTNDGSMYFYPYADDPTYLNNNVMQGLLEENVWQHIAVTWDYANKEAKIYSGATEVAYQTIGVPTYWNTIASTRDWHFGGSSVKPGQNLQGYIDEVKMYNYAMSTSEVYGEFMQAPAHAADIDRDACVELGELVFYMDDWKAGTVSMTDLVSGITEWKAGC